MTIAHATSTPTSGPRPLAAYVYIDPALASRVPNVAKAQPTKSRLTSDSTYEIHVPWPALANTSAGPNASEPLGPVPASDCANTSRNGSDRLRRPGACSGSTAGRAGDTDVDMRRSPLSEGDDDARHRRTLHADRPRGSPAPPSRLLRGRES